MKKRTGKIVAIALLVAFLGWIVFTSLPMGGEKIAPSKPNNTVVHEYEPKFTKEGELWIMSAENQDTIKQLDIEIADNATEAQYGMMYRKSMDPNTGMLFIMPAEQQQSFWMKNTYVALDIIYINSNFEIVSVQKNAVPHDLKSLPSEGPALYVLEVVGGFADEHGLKKGDKIQFERN
ncbi:DUF192 domain-containing protein [Owenweeksia hongkongensis]|uniref:DUF192 domain-containing protein n=1 Tax=Owenweeksia hongkongensis TaxID=253245 RepID=UPI003A8F8145